MIEESKEYWEIKAIRNKINLNRITVILGFLTVVFTVTGYFIDSSKTRKQISWELTLNKHHQKVKKMTEIALEFDQLYEETLNALNKANVDLVWFSALLSQFRTELDEFPNKSSLTKGLRTAADGLIEKLNNEELEIQQFKLAALLQEKWKVKEFALSPDFEFVYGRQLTKEWAEFSKLGWDILGDRYVGDTPNLDEFEKKGSEFQLKLYSAINKEEESFLLKK